MILTEKEMLKTLQSGKKVALVQPKYKTKYPPLGLGKISAYLKSKGIEVVGIENAPDLVCITSLFTYNSRQVFSAIDNALFMRPRKVLVGGVFASLMPNKIEERYKGRVAIFPGYSKKLDLYPPDLEGWPIDEAFQDYSFLFTSRGCPNSCAYCAVHRIEKEQWINPKWKNHIREDKKNVMISDNNISNCKPGHLESVVKYCIKNGKRILFDNGLDCKLITEEMAETLGGAKYIRHGMRLAFDRIEEDGTFQEAVKRLLKAGVPKSQIMAYVLFNFNDTPKEANYRMEECKKLGIRPYPQQYTPLNKMDRDEPYIGKHWNKSLLKSFRYFWLMAGEWNKKDFDKFMITHERYKVDKEGIALWNDCQEVKPGKTPKNTRGKKKK